jgi:hypothetical protein
MKKYFLFLIVLYSCNNRSSQKNNSANGPDSTKNEASKIDNPILRTMTAADSVILAIHYAPIEMEADENKKEPLDFNIVQNGKLNLSIVRGHKRLNSVALKELSEILNAPTEKDSIKIMCFEPRNGILLYRNGEILSYIDICFECYNFYIEGNWGANIIINRPKYDKLELFFKKLGLD